jgi:hypothetical protein
MKVTLMLLLALPFAALAQDDPQTVYSKMVLAQAPAGAAQAATPEAAKEEVEMNEEEAKKAREAADAEARKKAAEDAAAERQRQKEARMLLCVIRPVMSDEQIELCRVAYKD